MDHDSTGTGPLITHQTNGIQFKSLDRQCLKRARDEGNDQPVPEEVTAA